ncbi:hypothetical protein QYZ88_015875 [Lachnospiraceae bacterium C1.1]|nr:hypothetical protein [Lachnospiraceae bacterium C1.1]
MKSNVFIDEEKKKYATSDDNVFLSFLVSKGLYDEIKITPDNIWELASVVEGSTKIDVFCKDCGEKRVFASEKVYKHLRYGHEVNDRSVGEELITWQQEQNIHRSIDDDSYDNWTWSNNRIAYDTRIMAFRFHCAKNPSHRLDYVVLTDGNIMRKIGQFPSVADLSFPKLKEFRKVMTSRDDEKELKRAIGLYANGIGIGSFVYLRRIFERIVDKASKKAISDGKYKEKELLDLRVNDRVKKLSGYLPQAIVNSPVAYGIISKGIHELSEEECTIYFPVLQSFIMMVLRQWESIRKEAEEAEKLQKELNSIASNI